MARRSLNIWPAFSDMMFMFFIATMVSAMGLGIDNSEKEKELTELHAQVAELERENADLREALEEAKQDPELIAQLKAQVAELEETIAELRELLEMEDDQITCGGTGEFIDRFETCVSDRTGQTIPRDEATCSVTIGEKLVQFQTNSYKPRASSEKNADALAACLYSSLSGLDPFVLDNIQSVYIDGHTDCDGGPASNMKLGMNRAFELYWRFFDYADRRRGAEALTAKIVVRSFGQNQSTRDALCGDTKRKVDADRRVTISVQPRLN